MKKTPAKKPTAKKAPPFAFVLDALEFLRPETKPMFGCLAIYIGDRIVFILRDKAEPRVDNGLWFATTPEHHESLRKEFPSLRDIQLFGPGPTGWQVLPADSEDFEEDALRACTLVRKNDPRIGKIPKSKSPKPKSKTQRKR